VFKPICRARFSILAITKFGNFGNFFYAFAAASTADVSTEIPGPMLDEM